jgi:hypothetical protein
LGLARETIALDMERQRLIATGRPDLAERVVHVAVVEGDAAGYHIGSYEHDGTPRLIEVKTTRGAATAAFFVSPNEIALSRARSDNYVLIRVFGYGVADADVGVQMLPPCLVARAVGSSAAGPSGCTRAGAENVRISRGQNGG